jgi:uncharacterized protein (DUF3084 family)
MRPRHTAAVLTVGAGALIPLVTIMLLLAIDAEARKWVAEGPAVLVQRDHLKLEVTSLQAGIKREEARFAGVSDNLGKLQESYSKATNQLKHVQGNLQATVARLTSAQGRLQAVNQRLAALKSRYEEVGQSLLVARNSLEAVNNRLATLNRDYLKLKGDYAKLESQIALQRQQNDTLTQENRRVQEDLRLSKLDLEALKQNYEKAGRAYADDLARIQRDLVQASRELKDAQDAATFYEGIALPPRFNSMMFRKDEEVSRISASKGLSDLQARAAVRSLLRLARMNAENRGAKPRSNGIPSAGLFPSKTKTAAELENDAVSAITGADDDSLIVARSALNSFEGESVALYIARYANPVVFKSGQTIATARINGHLSEQEIFQQVNEFLQTELNTQAQKSGVILNSGSDEPAIQFTMPDIVDLVKRIKLNNRVVRLYAQAADSTRAAGPLRLRFQFE